MSETQQTAASNGTGRRSPTRPAFDGRRMADWRANVALMTQQELAARLGVSASLIYSYEANRRSPTVVRFRELLAALSVPKRRCTPEDLQPLPQPADGDR